MKQILVTIRNDRFTQFRRGVFQYLQRVIISLYPSHRTRVYRLRVVPRLEICGFETEADHLYPARSPTLGTRVAVWSPPDTFRIALRCLPDTPAFPHM